jgi:general secretion pathway protein E
MTTASMMNIPATFSREQLAQARLDAAAARTAVVDALERAAGLAPEQFAMVLAATAGLSHMTMAALSETEPLLSSTGLSEAMERGGLLVRTVAGLCAVLSDPFDTELRAWLDARAGAPVAWALVHRADLVAFLSMQQARLRALDAADLTSLAAEGAAADRDDLSFGAIEDQSSVVIRLVNSTIYDAMKAGASDIHIETGAAGLHVKYRLDGVLTSVARVAGLGMAEQVVSRVKVMAELDIAERRVPQDGRFALRYEGRDIDYRVSIMPNLVCEDVVIRVLDKRGLADVAEGLTLERLGFDPAVRDSVRQLARHPYGMLLVTGPTGSGKTTTMYAALAEINDGNEKIITIEDPIEYELPDVLQIPVNERKGLTFARGLRSILRHDPDKILVGEIRDAETAQIAIQSALTGHLVFTSVHANNAFDVLGRFEHMGVDVYSFVSALNGIVAQRLLRRVCSHCGQPHRPDAHALRRLGLDGDEVDLSRMRRGSGCGHCRGTGYKGRHAVGEVLVLNDTLREMIVARAPISSIKNKAREQGTRFLREAAVALALDGYTTVEEVDRVTFAS